MFVFRTVLYTILFYVVCGCSKKDDQIETTNKTPQVSIEDIQLQLNFRLKGLRESLEQKVDDIFNDASVSDLVTQINQLILQVEPGVQKVINDPLFAEILKDGQLESMVQDGALLIEIALIEKT